MFTFSQESKKNNYSHFGFIISANILDANFKDINKLFESNGISQFDNSLLNQGFGIYFTNEDKSSYGSVQYGYFDQTGTLHSTNISSEIKGWDMNISFNHNLLKNKPSTLLYPKIGLGLSMYQLNLVDKNYQLNNFPQILDSLSGEKSFKSNEIFYADLGAGFEKRLILFENTFFIGANLSYLINFNKLKWKSMGGTTINEMPGIKTGGLKISCVLRYEFDWDKLQSKSRKKKESQENPE